MKPIRLWTKKLTWCALMLILMMSCGLPFSKSNGPDLAETVAVLETRLAGQNEASGSTPQPPAARQTPAPPEITATVKPPPAGHVKLNMELVGQSGGTVFAAAARGEQAFIGVGPRLVSLDVSDPSKPRVISQTDVFPGVVHDVKLDGDYAYVADYDGGLRVVDISDPGQMREVGAYDMEIYAEALTLDGQYAYVASNAMGLTIVDISDPQQPRKAAYFAYPGLGLSVTVHEGIAYTAQLEKGVGLIDVSDPSNPIGLSTLDLGGPTGAVAYAEGVLYAAVMNDGVHVIDVRDPRQPKETGVVDTMWPYSLAVSGQRLFVSDYQGDLVYDISDPFKPRQAAVAPPKWPALGMRISVDGDLLYEAIENVGLRILRYNGADQLSTTGQYRPAAPGQAHDIVLRDGLAYVTGNLGGFSIFDVSDPAQPTEIGYSSEVRVAFGVELVGDIAFVTTGGDGLVTLDVSDPKKPRVISKLREYGKKQLNAFDLAVDGDMLYLALGANNATQTAELGVVDISDPSKPMVVGVYEFKAKGIGMMGIAAGDGYVYLPVNQDGLYVFQVNDPANPKQVGFIPVSEQLGWVSLHGTTLAMGTTTLTLLDVSDPAQPQKIGEFTEMGSYQRMDLQASRAYLGVYAWTGVLDVSDPATPRRLGLIDTPGLAMSAVGDGDLVYVADLWGGLSVFQLTGGD